MEPFKLDYARPGHDPARRPIGWLESAVLASAGIFLPMLCFASSINRYPAAPDYQRGEWSDYLALLPSVRASWPFAPLLFAATYAVAILVVAPHRVLQSRLLRLALYSGTILSAQYTLIQAIAITSPGHLLSWGTFLAIGAAALATLIAFSLLSIVPRSPRIKSVYLLPCLILIPLAIVAWRITLPIVLLAAILVALFAPAITLAAYLRLSFLVWNLAASQPRDTSRMRALIPITWIATYVTVWIVAFSSAIDLYNSLPKTPPDC